MENEKISIDRFVVIPSRHNRFWFEVLEWKQSRLCYVSVAQRRTKDSCNAFISQLIESEMPDFDALIEW